MKLQFTRILLVKIIVIISILSNISLSQSSLSKPIFLDLVQLEKLHSIYLKKNTVSQTIIQNILLDADSLLGMKPYSVIDKVQTPPSGDKHDFLSMGPYWWPDPSKPDGLPYIRKDGERNPEYYKITDESYLSKTIRAVEHLAIAAYISKNVKYVFKSAELIRVWFLDEKTKMNPNMKHGQYIPGINTGRGIGLIETRFLFKITDAIILLRNFAEWKEDDNLKIRNWFEDYFTWITTHEYGISESNEKNNHGTWYDVQLASIALFLGKKDYAKGVLEEAKHKRIDSQIETDGKQPLELARTKSWNYSVMNLSSFFHLALLGDNVGVDLWNYENASGGSIRKALDFLLPFCVDMSKWKYQQIGEYEVDAIYSLLLLAQKKYNKKIYFDWIKRQFADKKNSKIEDVINSFEN